LLESDIQIDGHGLNAITKKVMRHGRIEQGANHTAMQNAAIALPQIICMNFGGYIFPIL